MKKLLCIILLILISTAPAAAETVKLSGDLKAFTEISFPTPEGIHTFSMRAVDADRYLNLQGEKGAYFFKAKQLRRVIADVNPNAAASIIDGVLKINFFGRRHGRAYELTVDLKRPAEGRLIHVSTAFSPECATLDTVQALIPGLTGGSEKMAARELTLAVDGDHAMFKHFSKGRVGKRKASKNAKNYIRSVVNQVNSIYSSQLGIVVRLTSLDIDSNNKRSIKSKNSNDVLEAFRYYAPKTKSLVRSDIYHLFTANRLNGSVVGLAYVGSTCRSNIGNYAFGLSRLTNPAVQALVTAHELAHNLGATHLDGDSSIMSPVLNPSKNQFIPASMAQIFNFINQYGACLASIQ